MKVRLTPTEAEFLRLVKDDRDVLAFLRKHDIGYGWAERLGLVTKHEAWFEFHLTDLGRAALSALEEGE